MAYPTVSAPYGLIPVNLLGGQVFSGSTRQIPIQTAHGTSIYFGDVVLMSSNGCITTAVLTATTVNVVGIFMGCSYINSSGQRIYGQYYPALTPPAPRIPRSAIIAYVADDPDLVMKTAIVSGTTTVAQATRATMVGGNAALVANAGSTTTGNSAHGCFE
jgi:hypothetical protein